LFLSRYLPGNISEKIQELIVSTENREHSFRATRILSADFL
jgi:hypothetical protein